MRILVINWEDRTNPFAGGAETNLHEIFSRIAQAGHEVVLLVSHFEGAKQRETLDGLDVHRYGHFKTFNYEMPIYYRRHLARGNFDIVIDDINKVPFCTPKWINRPIIAIAHHFFGKAVYQEVAWPYATYIYLWEKVIGWAYRNTPFIAVSEHTKSEIIEKGIPEELIHIVHNGVDPRQYHLDEAVPKNETPLIVHFGRLKKYKSVDVVIRAMAIVKDTFADAKLLIIGEGDDRPRLEGIVRELNLQNWVTFTGFTDRLEVVRYLHRSWVVVNGSIKEGWGLTVIEANACETPVIAADSPGLRESVLDGETGWLVPYGDVDAFAAKISHVLSNHEDRHQKAQKARQWSQNFLWDVSAQKTLDIITNYRQGR